MSKTLPAPVRVREAVAADIPAIVELWWQLASEHATRDPGYWGLMPEVRCREVYRGWKHTLFSEEARPTHIHLVAEIGGKVVGFVHGQIVERPEIFKLRFLGRVNEVVVHRDYRRRGVGKAMVPALEAAFRARGVSNFNLMVDGDNDKAQRLYSSLGYRVREQHLVKVK